MSDEAGLGEGAPVGGPGYGLPGDPGPDLLEGDLLEDDPTLDHLLGEVPAGMTPGGAGTPRSGDAVVKVVRGDPDALELAALIAGLTAASAAAATEAEQAVRHRWMDRSHALRLGARGMPSRGGDAWRWSLHP